MATGVMERNLTEVALNLGRCLVLETKRGLAYRASRQDASDYEKFLALFFKAHEAIMIDRQLWQQASLTLSDACNLELQLIEHVLALTPHSILCQSTRGIMIDQVNMALGAYCVALKSIVASYADPDTEQTYLTDTLAKTTRDTHLSLLEKSLHDIKHALFKCCNFSILEQGLLTEPTEGLSNAIHYDSDTVLDQYSKINSNYATFFTEFVPKDGDDDKEEGDAATTDSSFFFNVAYPRYLSPRIPPSGKQLPPTEESYVDMDRLTVEMANNLIYRIVLPLRQMLHLDPKPIPFEQQSIAAISIEILCAGLLDLFSRNVLDASLIRRYFDNLAIFLAGYDHNSFDVPNPSPSDSNTLTQIFLSREMCFLMPLSSYGFLKRIDCSAIVDNYMVSRWDESRLLNLKQVEQMQQGRPIKSLSDLPADMLAVPLASCYGAHETYMQDFGQIVQGMSNKVIINQVDQVSFLALVGANQEQRLAVPDVLDSHFYEILRLSNEHHQYSTVCRSANQFPKFLMNASERNASRENARWHIKSAVTLPRNQLEVVTDSSRGIGSALRLFELSLQSRHAEEFMDRFNVLLDKMVELFAAVKPRSLFEGFAQCKSLVSTATSEEMRLKLVDGFSNAMQNAAPLVSEYCSLLKVFHTVDSRVRTAVMINRANREESFQTRLRAASSAGDETLTQSSDDTFDSESVIVFEWDDCIVTDSPSTIVRNRNELRQAISLRQIAQHIDSNLGKNPMLAKVDLKLNLAKSLEILAEREMENEDRSTSEMASLHELYDYWQREKAPHIQYSNNAPRNDQYFNAWLGDALYIGALDTLKEPMHALSWFSIEPYLRQILIDSWYLPSNSEELSMSADKCQHKGILVAPLAERRRPLLLDSNGPLSIVLGLINSLCLNAVQFTKTHLDTKFSKTLEKIYNASGELKTRRNDMVSLVMPKIVEMDEFQNMVEKFADELHQVEDDADAKSQAMGFFLEAVMVLMYEFPRLQDSMNQFSANAGIDSRTIMIRCMRIIVQLVFSPSATRLASLFFYEKSRLFASWRTFKKAVQESAKTVPFPQAVAKVKVIELQKVMFPPTVLQLLNSYFGNFVEHLNRAHNFLDSNVDEKSVGNLMQNFILPFLKMINKASGSSSDGDGGSSDAYTSKLMDLKSEHIKKALKEGKSLGEFVTCFIDDLDGHAFWFKSSECEFSVVIYQDEHIDKVAARLSEYAKRQSLETLSLEAVLSSSDSQKDFPTLDPLSQWLKPILLERGLLLKRQESTVSSFGDNYGWVITLSHQ